MRSRNFEKRRCISTNPEWGSRHGSSDRSPSQVQNIQRDLARFLFAHRAKAKRFRDCATLLHPRRSRGGELSTYGPETVVLDQFIVHRVRRNIRSVRPTNRPKFVDPRLGEEVQILERCKYTAFGPSRQIDDSHHAIAEPNPKPVVLLHLKVNYTFSHARYSKGAIFFNVVSDRANCQFSRNSA